jgi:hypothetical protein
MRFVTAFGRFWYDFIVGDDWKLAIGAVAAITIVFVAAHNDVNAWWLLPLAVPALLGVSLLHATRGGSGSAQAH